MAVHLPKHKIIFKAAEYPVVLFRWPDSSCTILRHKALSPRVQVPKNHILSKILTYITTRVTASLSFSCFASPASGVRVAQKNPARLCSGEVQFGRGPQPNKLARNPITLDSLFRATSPLITQDNKGCLGFVCKAQSLEWRFQLRFGGIWYDNHIGEP